MTIDLMRHAASASHSPCIGHCTHDAGGHCLSCCRHEAEVATWRDVDDAARLKIWGRLPQQIDDRARGIMRLPLDQDDITDLAAATLAAGGAWMAGFTGNWIKADRHDGGLVASNAEGARITLDLSGKVRAVVWAPQGSGLADGLENFPILLVTPVARLTFPVHDTVTELEDGRVDQGLGLASVRLVAETAGRLVIETPLARVEGLSPTVPAKAAVKAVPDGLDIGKSYALGAILMPAGQRL